MIAIVFPSLNRANAADSAPRAAVQGHPLADLAPGNGVGWLYLPRLGASKGILANALGTSLGPRLSKLLLESTDGSALLLAGGNGLGHGAEISGWFWARGQADGILAALRRVMRERGFSAEGGADSMTLKRINHRMHLAKSADYVALSAKTAYLPGQVGGNTLAKSHGFELFKKQGDVDLFAHLDVARVFGELAKGRNGREIAGRLTRLGVSELRTAHLALRQSPQNGLLVDAAIGPLPKDASVVSVLGEPTAASFQVPNVPGLLAYAEGQLRGGLLFDVITRLYSFEAPLQFALVQSQIFDLQRRLGKNLPRDVLGDAPQTWRLLTVESAGRSHDMLVATVVDGPGLGQFIEPLGQILTAVIPALQVEKRQQGNTMRFLLRQRGKVFAVLLIEGNHVWLAEEEAILERHLGALKKSSPNKPATDLGQANLWGWLAGGKAVHSRSGLASSGLDLSGVRHAVGPVHWVSSYQGGDFKVRAELAPK